MNQKVTIENAAAIVFSASLDNRNYLRNQVSGSGFRPVCFNNESICFDNFETIQPEIVIAETDSAETVWRFVFAMHAFETAIPLMIVSDRLKAGLFINKGLRVPLHTIAMNHLETRVLEKVIQITKNKRRVEKGTKNYHPSLFVGQTEAIKKIRSMLPSIADTRDPVLIAGEQGTGKELLAWQIAGMKKGKKNIIKIDCGKLKPDMIVDAALKKIIAMGKKGRPINIFMDHIDQMTKACQAEMLLLIEASKQMGNGSEANSGGAIRFIAATDKKIEGLVEKGGFRKDLFYRLNVIPINIPPLRERKADISLLMDYFIINACIEHQKCIMISSQKAREICTMHDWPGNVEELQNQMYRIVEEGSEAHLLTNTGVRKVHKNKKYLLNCLAVEELAKSYKIKDHLPVLNKISLKGICDEFVAKTERRLMKRALESTNWNRKKAAKLLNISYKSMLNKMKAYDID